MEHYRRVSEVRIGISGWLYPPWRGVFYPPGLPHRAELSYAASRLNSIEINGSFYSLQRPSSYATWRRQTPDGFVFAVKGAGSSHHEEAARRRCGARQLLRLRRARARAKLGPILWQLPPSLGFDAERLDAFFALLPRSTAEAAYLARRHDARLQGRAWTGSVEDRPLRHALEIRHASFQTPLFLEVLRRHGVALVVADTAGRWPLMRDVTSDFVYVRLHGDTELYTSGYDDDALDRWAATIRGWLPHDVYVYFDNDVKVRAPVDAMALATRLGVSHAASDSTDTLAAWS